MRRIVSSHQQAELLAGLQRLAWSGHSKDWHDWFYDDKDLPAYEVQDAQDWLRTHDEKDQGESEGKHEKKTAGLYDHFRDWPVEKLHNYHRYLTTTQYGDSSDAATIDAIQQELGKRNLV